MKPEAAIILAGAREIGNDAARERIKRELGRVKSIATLERAIELQKVAPLLHKTLDAVLDEHAHPELRRLVSNLRAFTVTRWLPHRQRLLHSRNRLTSLLSEANIPHAFFRGLEHAERFYDTPSLRWAEDVDVLVPVEHEQRALRACTDGGFALAEHGHVQIARQAFTRQVELLDTENGVRVDLNFELTGNSQIGYVPFDMDQIWNRARPTGDTTRFELSHEDVFLESVRHMVHGHDFSNGIAKVCCDVASLMHRVDTGWDVDYILYQSRKAEMVEGLRQFVYFFDEYYANGTDSSLARRFAGNVIATPAAHARRYSRGIVLGQMLRFPSKNILATLLSTNIAMCGKVWIVDRTPRAIKLILMVLRPNVNERTLVLNLVGVERYEGWGAVLRYYLILLCLSPGIGIGMTLHLLRKVVTVVTGANR